MTAASAFRLAWKLLPKVPVPLAVAGSAVAANVMWLVNPAPVRQLGRNLARISGTPAPANLVRKAVVSYFRSFAQQFTLPGWSEQQIRESVIYEGAEDTRKLMENGPVVLALTHSGNWDLAGAWFGQEYGPILTVAEKLEPKDLFDQSVEFRRSLGMEIIGVGKGDHVFPELVEKARGKSLLVPLLADRDISGAGIEVMLGSEPALVAAGPAALAHTLGRPLIAGVLTYERQGKKLGRRWVLRARFTDPIPCPEPAEGETVVEAWTRKWVETIVPVMAEFRVDWHMMQKVYVEDLDAKRLARAAKRHEQDPRLSQRT